MNRTSLTQCIACAADCHTECFSPVDTAGGVAVCCCSLINEEFSSILDGPVDEATSYGGFKDKTNSIDPKSTGRKRAAKLYPIPNGMPCEWRGLKSAGGAISIMGCVNGIALHRHHGPNKDTLHNEQGNVHRICTNCHNRWHAKNDAEYDWQGPWNPHDPTTLATEEELARSEIYWANNRPKKAKEE